MSEINLYLAEKFKIKLYTAKIRLKGEYSWLRLREPKVKGQIPHDAKIQAAIKQELQKSGYTITDISVDINDYQRYMEKANYSNYPFYAHNIVEKSLEHYLAAKLLDLSFKDIYIDVASSSSPVAEIYQNVFSCKTYRIDLVSSKETKSNMIIGDAGNIPLKNGCASKMALHCSFEHFEQDADIRFVKEANRVLCKGGKLCIIPLYFFNKYAIQIDPSVLFRKSLHFEDDAVLYATLGYGNRHGRFYDVVHFTKRIRDNLGDLELSLLFLTNEKEVDPSCYVKFIAFFEKIT
jgi:Methyltransferase domain